MPRPDGKLWIATGIYPGWQTGIALSLADPREPAPSPEEVGRGPLPETLGRFSAVRFVGDGVVLEYTIGATSVCEWMSASENAGQPVVERHFQVAASGETLRLVLGVKSAATVLSLGLAPDSPAGVELVTEGNVASVRVPSRRAPVNFAVAFINGTNAAAAPVTVRPFPSGNPQPRWPQEVATTLRHSAKDAYVVDHSGCRSQTPGGGRCASATSNFSKTAPPPS